MPWPIQFALRELWSQRGRSLLSLLALALSVGLVIATASISALMRASVAAPAPPLIRPGELLWISSAYDVDYDLPADLAAQIEPVAGVAGVQPVLRRPVRVSTPRADTLTLLGVEPAAYFDFHDLDLAAGILPSAEAPGLVALAPWAYVRDLSLGSPITLTTPVGDVPLPLTGLIEVETLVSAQQGLVLYAPLDTVAELFRVHDAITSLEVRLEPSASLRGVRAELEQMLGPAYAVSGAAQPGSGPQLWQRLVMGTLLFVDGLVLVGSAMLVYAVFATATRSRRRQVGLLRSAGAQRQQVMALFVAEAAALGLAGSGLGVLLGLLLARVGAFLVLAGTENPSAPPLPAGSLLLAVTLGLLASLSGSVGPAIRAAWLSPLAALYDSPAQPAPRSSGTGPGWAPAFLIRRFPVTAHLAAANLARQRSRTLLLVSALALILAMALGSVGVLSLLGEELAAALDRLTGGDYLVLPGLTTISLRELAGQDTSDVPPLDPGLLAALEAMGDRVWLMGGTTADVEALQVFPGQPTILLDVEGYARMGGFRFQAGDWPTVLEAFRQGPAVLLAPVVARRLGVELGDVVRLDTPHGPVDFRVAGIGDSEFTTSVLDLEDGATYLGANEVNAVMVQARPGNSPETTRRLLLDAVQTHGGTLVPLSQASAQLRAVFSQARLSISLLIALAGLVAMLGVVNAALSSVAERRREIGLLRAVGATQPQVIRLLLSEMALLGGAAALAGTVLGWAATILFLGVAQAHLGFSGEGVSSLAAWLPLMVATLASWVLWPMLTMLGGLAPALHASRLPVIRALYQVAGTMG